NHECERQSRAPGRADLVAHRPGVREGFESRRRIAEPVDANALEFVGGGQSRRRRRDDTNRDTDIAKGGREPEHERAHRIGSISRKGVSEKENLHAAETPTCSRCRPATSSRNIACPRGSATRAILAP